MSLTWQFYSFRHYAFFLQLHFGRWSRGFYMTFFIISLYDFWHIVHATVAGFSCILGENFVKFVSSWKIFCYQLKECICNIWFAKSWVKPYYVSVLHFWYFWLVISVFQINTITRLLQHIFVFNFHHVKNFLVRKIFRQPFRDGIW